jgi:cytochrome c oxidase assembly protein subunit 11
MSQAAPVRAGENRRLRLRLAVVALAMFGFGYALVPFYDAICAALGVNEFIKADAAPAVNSQVDGSRTVTIELDANAHNLPWSFRPLVRHITVHPGELATVEYEIANVRSEPVTAPASTSARWNASASSSRRSPPARRAACRWCSWWTRNCPGT